MTARKSSEPDDTARDLETNAADLTTEGYSAEEISDFKGKPLGTQTPPSTDSQVGVDTDFRAKTEAEDSQRDPNDETAVPAPVKVAH